MSKTPVVSGHQALAALQQVGYATVRQKGSHVRMRHPSDPARKPVTIPLHRSLKVGTLRAILRDANLTVEQFTQLLK